VGQGLGQLWTPQTLNDWLVLVGIPQILLTGLVQEGAKMVPIVIWWWSAGRSLDPKLGLVIGAVAGAGFGVFEAVWAHNSVLASGWSWGLVQDMGVTALAPFWERFFAVAFHISASALAGYGLARGWGWQAYLFAALLHSLLNYSAVLLASGLFTIVYVEIYAAVVAVLTAAWMLWLRWRREEVAEVIEE
jgi:RsiW-degrading membrane proteinase PrsW (M82 family)